MIFFRNFEGIFEIQNQSAVGNAEVRRAKLWQNEILQTNLFSFAIGEGSGEECGRDFEPFFFRFRISYFAKQNAPLRKIHLQFYNN
jgi:hypothetical protein